MPPWISSFNRWWQYLVNVLHCYRSLHLKNLRIQMFGKPAASIHSSWLHPLRPLFAEISMSSIIFTSFLFRILIKKVAIKCRPQPPWIWQERNWEMKFALTHARSIPTVEECTSRWKVSYILSFNCQPSYNTYIYISIYNYTVKANYYLFECAGQNMSPCW